MTQDQKAKIAELAPTNNMKQIAEQVGATYDAVNSYCRKYGITPQSSHHAKKPFPKKVKEGCFDVTMYENWIVGPLKYFPKTA